MIPSIDVITTHQLLLLLYCSVGLCTIWNCITNACIHVCFPLLQWTNTETSLKRGRGEKKQQPGFLSFHFVLVILQGAVFCLCKTHTNIPMRRTPTLKFLFTSKNFDSCFVFHFCYTGNILRMKIHTIWEK